MVSDSKPWLQSYSPGMPSNLDYPRVPLYHFLQDSAARFPYRPAIIYQDPADGQDPVAISYSDLDEMSSRFM